MYWLCYQNNSIFCKILRFNKHSFYQLICIKINFQYIFYFFFQNKSVARSLTLSFLEKDCVHFNTMKQDIRIEACGSNSNISLRSP